MSYRTELAMKKFLPALLVLGAFAGAASAQSSVTIYGVVDLGITKGNGGTAPNDGGNGTSKAYILKQSTPSRLGFRGSEDLGGGLSAQFHIEHRFFADEGTQNGTPFWQGRSYVQLTSTTLGRVYLGREYEPAFWVGLRSDPFGQVGVGSIGAPQYAGYAAGPTSGARTNNTIGYKSPALGGLNINAAVGLGEAVFPRAMGFNVEYGAGPVYAAVGYSKLKGGPTPSLDGNSLVALAFTYDIGFVKPMFYFARAEVNGGALSNDMASVGVTAPIGTGTLKAVFARLSPDDATVAAIGGVGAGNGRQTKFAIGYDYPLSKRTKLYADASTGRKAGTVGNVATAAGFSNNNAFDLGVFHAF